MNRLALLSRRQESTRQGHGKPYHLCPRVCPAVRRWKNDPGPSESAISPESRLDQRLCLQSMCVHQDLPLQAFRPEIDNPRQALQFLPPPKAGWQGSRPQFVSGAPGIPGSRSSSSSISNRGRTGSSKNGFQSKSLSPFGSFCRPRTSNSRCQTSSLPPRILGDERR